MGTSGIDVTRGNPALRKYIAGAVLLQRGAYSFRCPVCGKIERNDDQYPPCCTGPHPSLHEHEMTPMARVDVEDLATHRRIWG